MKRITLTMINKWNMEDTDWLGYKLQNKDYFSYHHIIPKRNGGKATIDNGAILTSISHPYIHIIENKDIELYIYINNLLKNINNQRYMPTRQQLMAINSILKQFEREHSSDITTKGYYLIKEEYTRRLVK